MTQEVPGTPPQLAQLLERYSLPPGTNREALERVLSRLGLSAADVQTPAPAPQVQLSSSPKQSSASQKQQQQQQQQMTTPRPASAVPDSRTVLSSNGSRLRAKRPTSAVGAEHAKMNAAAEQVVSLREQLAQRSARVVEVEGALSRREDEIRQLKAKHAALVHTKIKKGVASSPGPNTGEVAVYGGSPPVRLLGGTLRDKARWEQLESAARAGDRRLALLLKSHRALHEECERVKAELLKVRDERDQMREALETEARERELLRRTAETTQGLLEEELAERRVIENKLVEEGGQRKHFEHDAARLATENAELHAERDLLAQKHQETLSRLVKRDHTIDALQKKLNSLQDAGDAATIRAAKAEEENAGLEERMRSLRRRNAQLEQRHKADDEERHRLQQEMDIKEEEARMLAAMLSSSSAQVDDY